MQEPGFRVLLTEAGNREAAVVRAPVGITEPDWLEAAEVASRTLEAAGAHTAVLCDRFHRTITQRAGPLDPAPCRGPWPPESCGASRPQATDQARTPPPEGSCGGLYQSCRGASP